MAGSSLANMFPDQLRGVPKRNPGAASSGGANSAAANATSAGGAAGGESSSSPDNTSQAPMRLSDMLKRKRTSKRSFARKGRHSDPGSGGGEEERSYWGGYPWNYFVL